jgi:predicted RNase H-like HicB family nuclease
MSRKGVVELKIYAGDFHREGDVWVAEVREVPQAHTYGRTLARTKEHLRDALALLLDVPIDTVDITVHIDGVGEATELVDIAIRARQQAERLNEEARQATSRAAIALVRIANLSFRDAGAALGMSHQRVEQLVSEAPSPPGRKAPARRSTSRSRKERV